MAKKLDGWWIPEVTVENRHPVLWRHKGLGIVPMTVKHVKSRGLALQAGGHLGLWPLELARYFERVITFEAHEENFQCLKMNLKERGKNGIIQEHYGALGERHCTVRVHRAKTTGSHFVIDDHRAGNCPMVTIDELGLTQLDALLLDIEGYEMRAIEGGLHTIARFKPVIACEENTCGERYGHKPGDIEKLLKPMGYRLKARRKKDIILTC